MLFSAKVYNKPKNNICICLLTSGILGGILASYELLLVGLEKGKINIPRPNLSIVTTHSSMGWASRGREYWTVNYTGTQSFKNSFFNFCKKFGYFN